MKLKMEQEEHRARMAESSSRVGLNMAEMNRILNPVIERNAVKRSSVSGQPRHGRAVKVVSSPKQLKQPIVGQNPEYWDYYQNLCYALMVICLLLLICLQWIVLMV